MGPTKTLLEAIAVTAELTRTQLSEPAAKVMAMDLSAYPEPQVIKALTRCRREVRGQLTVADVLTRLDDGRPGPEEAWAMLPKDEGASCVWTEEMAAAYGIAAPLLDENLVQARMAFVEAYKARVQAARDAGAPVSWLVSLGHDPHAREAVLNDAVVKGRLTASYAQELLPAPSGIRFEDVVRHIALTHQRAAE